MGNVAKPIIEKLYSIQEALLTIKVAMVAAMENSLGNQINRDDSEKSIKPQVNHGLSRNEKNYD